ncbi:MAG: ATPase domain-containing protein [Candidatus Bathyarchaeia archaeon]
MRRIPTGVEKLDEILQGGFPEGSTILIAGGPGTGKTILAAQFIYLGAAKYREKGVFVTFEEGAESFKNNMLTLGWNFDNLQKKQQVEILDLLSLKETDKAEAALDEIIETVRVMGAKRLVIDSITALTVVFRSMAEVRTLISILQKVLRRLGCTTILTAEIPWGSGRLGTGVEEFLSDGIIMLEMVSRENFLRRRLIVLKMRATDLNLRYYQYNISKNIGVELLPYPEAEE